MSLGEIKVGGTLRPDGTLELDRRPALAPGRVTVVLRPEAASAAVTESWWQYLQQARRELEASGATFLNEQEVNDHIDWLREEDRIDELLREADGSGQAGGS